MSRNLTYRRLAGAVSALLVATTPALAQESAPAVSLRGVIRDFQSGHPDFGPDLRQGHFPGSVELVAGRTGKPVFSGAGYEAVEPWSDRLGRPIAPHLWNAGRLIIEVAEPPEINPAAVVDSYDSARGQYDPYAAGRAPDWLVGSPMPTVAVPALGGAELARFVQRGGGTTTLSEDLRCRHFELSDLHTLKIEGRRRIVVDGAFTLRAGARILLAPGAELDLYIMGAGSVDDSVIGAEEDTGRIGIHYLSHKDLRIEQASQVHGRIISPHAPVRLLGGSDVYGGVTARSVILHDTSGLHIEGRTSGCGPSIDDERGTAGSPGGAIDSADSFGQWFEDILGVNSSLPHDISMSVVDGTFEYRDDMFFPIDGKLYGNEGQAHNYYFTYEGQATFTYQACAGQAIWFEGSDDCWIFVGDRLVIDLGGIGAGEGQFVELDRLNLTDGRRYSFRLFYAHRHPGPARFHLRTNFELTAGGLGGAAVGKHD
ncbi:MAG: fibro-slime domain-containing protein [Phycisphaerales bacterium JB039]